MTRQFRGPSYSIAPTAAYDGLLKSFAPQGWWKLADASGSSTAADSSGNGYTGTATSVTFGETGPVTGNTAGSFNGTSSAVTTTLNPSGWNALSVVGWYNFNGTFPATTNPRIVANDHTDQPGDDNGFELFIAGADTTSGVYWYVGNGSVAASVTVPNVGHASGWHMLVGVYDGSSIYVYQDGAVIGSASAPGGPVSKGSNGVGIGFDPAYTGDYVAGYLAEVAVFDAVLSPVAIQRLYASAAVSGSGVPTFRGSDSYNFSAVLPS